MLVKSFEKEFGKKLVWVNVSVSCDWREGFLNERLSNFLLRNFGLGL